MHPHRRYVNVSLLIDRIAQHIERSLIIGDCKVALSKRALHASHTRLEHFNPPLIAAPPIISEQVHAMRRQPSNAAAPARLVLSRPLAQWNPWLQLRQSVR